jgi:Protein of unknown function (DUF1153)
MKDINKPSQEANGTRLESGQNPPSPPTGAVVDVFAHLGLVDVERWSSPRRNLVCAAIAAGRITEEQMQRRFSLTQTQLAAWMRAYLLSRVAADSNDVERVNASTTQLEKDDELLRATAAKGNGGPRRLARGTQPMAMGTDETPALEPVDGRTQALQQLVSAEPGRGYRYYWKRLRAIGVFVNHKAVYRMCKANGWLQDRGDHSAVEDEDTVVESEILSDKSL